MYSNQHSIYLEGRVVTTVSETSVTILKMTVSPTKFNYKRKIL